MRHRSVTIWQREQVSSGLKVVSLVPLVMPSFTAQRTASEYQRPSLTSAKGF